MFIDTLQVGSDFIRFESMTVEGSENVEVAPKEQKRPRPRPKASRKK